MKNDTLFSGKTWYTFNSRGFSNTATTFCADESDDTQERAIEIMYKMCDGSGSVMRKATESEIKDAIKMYKKDPFAEVELDKLLELDVFPCVTARLYL